MIEFKVQIPDRDGLNDKEIDEVVKFFLSTDYGTIVSLLNGSVISYGDLNISISRNLDIAITERLGGSALYIGDE